MGTTAEKLAYLKETKNQIKQALETPSNVMRDYTNWIKKYVDNQPTQVVTDGICTNALDVPLVSLRVDGNSYQGENPSPEYPQDIEVIDGVNRFDINKLKQGTWNNKYALQRVTIWATKIDIGESYTIINYDTSKYNFSCGVSSSNGYNESATASDDSSWLTSSTYTITASTTGYLFIQIKTPTGKNIKPSDLLSSDFQIIKGTITKPYLPYGCIGLEQKGINVLDLSKKPYNENSSTLNGAVVTVNGGILNIDTTSSTNEAVIRSKWENYTSKNSLLLPKGSYYTKLILNVTNLNGVTKGQLTGNFTLDEDCVCTQWFITINIGRKIELPLFISNDQTKTSYEPYHEPKIIPINLAGNSLAKVRDIKDLLKVYRNGDVEIEKKIGKVVLYGSEWWYIQNNMHYQITFGERNRIYLKQSGIGISNYFEVNSREKGVHLYPILQSNVDYLRIQNGINKWSTLKDFKKWLSTHNTELYYQLATPQKLTLPTTEPIKMWEGTNKFELITNLDTTFEMEYVVNKDYLETQNLLNIVEGENI